MTNRSMPRKLRHTQNKGHGLRNEFLATRSTSDGQESSHMKHSDLEDRPGAHNDDASDLPRLASIQCSETAMSQGESTSTTYEDEKEVYYQDGKEVYYSHGLMVEHDDGMVAINQEGKEAYNQDEKEAGSKGVDFQTVGKEQVRIYGLKGSIFAITSTVLLLVLGLAVGLGVGLGRKHHR
jgi:hypothetical protein